MTETRSPTPAATCSTCGASRRVYYEFYNRPLDALRAAAELGLTIEQLRAGISQLASEAPELAPLLGDGAIDRAAFTARYAGLACSSGPRNLPTSCP